MIEKTLHGGQARLIYGQSCIASLRQLESESIHCVVTSPPFWNLRNYCDHPSQLGLETTPQEFVDNLVDVFREIHRVLRSDGTVWLNLGDTYASNGYPNNAKAGLNQRMFGDHHADGRQSDDRARHVPSGEHGLKVKDLVGIPWRVALALQADGWWLRQDIIWHKPNPMPESCTDRCTKSHEYIFLLTKSAKYYSEFGELKEPAVSGERFHGGYDAVMADGSKGHSRNGRDDPNNRANWRNKRSVWTIASQSYHGAHFAVFPEEIPRLAIKAGSPIGGTVLDPFSGSGTTGKVALQLGRNYIGLDVNEEYLDLALRRVDQFRSDSPTQEEDDGQETLFSGVDE